MARKPLNFKIIVNNDILMALSQEKDSVVMFDLIEKNRSYLKEWLPWLDANKTVEDALSHIKETQKAFDNKKSLTLGIWYRNKLCGVTGFHAIDHVNRCGKIGYWLGAAYKGKGIMTKSCKKLIEYGFDELNLNRIEVKCAVGNKKSWAIPERLGFELEGVCKQAEWLYDHFVDIKVYGLTKDKWTGI